jgi:hypothetical protein
VVVLQANDLQGVKAYSALDQEGLYTLGTAVVDYRGYRVTAQSIIPGWAQSMFGAVLLCTVGCRFRAQVVYYWKVNVWLAACPCRYSRT